MNKKNRPVPSRIINGTIEAIVKILLNSKIERGGFTLGNLAEAASLATEQAHKKALEFNVKLVTEVDGYLYESVAGGPKVKISKVVKPSKQFPVHFKLR